ncbi:MAG: hypothetical protein QOJ07_1320 [Thermoleophilaceae bacterium]|jgi:hypothetical protein|nr:hypothetical protein [Thermoleophilaceae bacterium]
MNSRVLEARRTAARMNELFAARHARLAAEREASGDAAGAERSRALSDRQQAEAGRLQADADAVPEAA